jgi:hypothetical protein
MPGTFVSLLYRRMFFFVALVERRREHAGTATASQGAAAAAVLRPAPCRHGDSRKSRCTAGVGGGGGLFRSVANQLFLQLADPAHFMERFRSVVPFFNSARYACAVTRRRGPGATAIHERTWRDGANLLFALLSRAAASFRTCQNCFRLTPWPLDSCDAYIDFQWSVRQMETLVLE